MKKAGWPSLLHQIDLELKEGDMLNFSRREALKLSALAAAGAIPPVLPYAVAGTPPQDALAVMSADPRFSTWVQVLKYAGLQDYAQSGDNFTAFIPTDTAFEKYPWVVEDVLRARTRPFPETTQQVEFIRSHVIIDLHPLSEFSGRKTVVTSISGNPIMIDGLAGNTYSVAWQSVADHLATAKFRNDPIVASNALLYAFDEVTFT